MEKLLTEKSCTLSGAADAIGRTTETLRGWLGRGGAGYIFTSNKGGWRRFFSADIALMALAAPMIEFGMKPEFAFKLARDLIQEKITFAKVNGTTEKHLAAAFAAERAIIRHDVDRWRAVLVSDRHGLPGGPALVLNPCDLILKAFWRMSGNLV